MARVAWVAAYDSRLKFCTSTVGSTTKPHTMIQALVESSMWRKWRGCSLDRLVLICQHNQQQSVSQGTRCWCYQQLRPTRIIHVTHKLNNSAPARTKASKVCVT